VPSHAFFEYVQPFGRFLAADPAFIDNQMSGNHSLTLITVMGSPLQPIPTALTRVFFHPETGV
jgi:hypothetical protein